MQTHEPHVMPKVSADTNINHQKMKFSQKIKRDFTRPSFLLAVTCITVMLVIVALGNPRVGGFYYHYIPEILGIYCFGIWTRQVKFTLRKVLLLSVFIAITTPLMLGNLFYVLITAWLASACPLGYIIERSNEKFNLNAPP